MKDLDFGSALDSNCGRNMSLSDKDFKYLFRRAMPGVDPHGTGLLTYKCVWCHEKFDTRMIHAETCCVTIRGANRHSAQVRQVQEFGGFARLTGLTMYVPPSCYTGVPPICTGCEECEKEHGVRVDVEFAGFGDDGSYGVDVANVEIRIKGAKCTAKHTVSAPVAKAEEKKKKLYKALCKETRDVTFIPAVMSSFSAPGKGMSNLVRVLAEIIFQ